MTINFLSYIFDWRHYNDDFAYICALNNTFSVSDWVGLWARDKTKRWCSHYDVTQIAKTSTKTGCRRSSGLIIRRIYRLTYKTVGWKGNNNNKNYLACIFVCYLVDCFAFGGLIFVKAALSLDPYTQWKGNDECNCVPEIVCLNDTYPVMWILSYDSSTFFFTDWMCSSLIGFFFLGYMSSDWLNSILTILERSLLIIEKWMNCTFLH